MIRVIPLAADATCGRSRAAVNKDVATVMIYMPKEYIPPTDLSKMQGLPAQDNYTIFIHKGDIYMIKIDMKQNQTEFKGSTAQLIKETIILTHSIITSLLPKLKGEDRRALKESMAMAWVGEIGLEALKEMGLLNDFTQMDLTQMANLIKEDDGHDEANG